MLECPLSALPIYGGPCLYTFALALIAAGCIAKPKNAFVHQNNHTEEPNIYGFQTYCKAMMDAMMDFIRRNLFIIVYNYSYSYSYSYGYIRRYKCR